MVAESYMHLVEIADKYRTKCPVLFFFAGRLLYVFDAGRAGKGPGVRIGHAQFWGVARVLANGTWVEEDAHGVYSFCCSLLSIPEVPKA